MTIAGKIRWGFRGSAWFGWVLRALAGTGGGIRGVVDDIEIVGDFPAPIAGPTDVCGLAAVSLAELVGQFVGRLAELVDSFEDLLVALVHPILEGCGEVPEAGCESRDLVAQIGGRVWNFGKQAELAQGLQCGGLPEEPETQLGSGGDGIVLPFVPAVLSGPVGVEIEAHQVRPGAGEDF